MEKYSVILFIVIVVCSIFFKSCTKDDSDIRYVSANTTSVNDTFVNLEVSTRYGITSKAEVLFLQSATTSNYRFDSLLHVYVAYNAEKIDSFVLDQVSPSHAFIYYTNIDKFDAANYNIQIIFKDGTVELLRGFLAPYKGSHYVYKPDPDKDLFYKSKATKLIYKQKKAYSPQELHHIDYTTKIHVWETYKDNIMISKKELQPTRITDYEFTLDNRP